MGYHLINIVNGKMETFFINEPEEIIELNNIDENTIVYEADEKWHPFIIAENDKLSGLMQESMRLGLTGQKYFRELMKQNQIIYEEINQSQENMKQYIAKADGKVVKRGDYILRTLGHLEIEVKVRSLYVADGMKFFTVDYSEIKSLERMQSILKNKIAFSIFERKDSIIEKGEIYSITVNKILELNRNSGLKYNDKLKYLEIPIKYCLLGIDGLKNL